MNRVNYFKARLVDKQSFRTLTQSGDVDGVVTASPMVLSFYSPKEHAELAESKHIFRTLDILEQAEYMDEYQSKGNRHVKAPLMENGVTLWKLEQCPLFTVRE